MFTEKDNEMKVGEIDAMYLRCILANHTFKNPTLQSFINELKETFEDVAQMGNLHNHVDGSGNFIVSVRAEKEE